MPYRICDCLCHVDHGIQHCMPCCSPCPVCHINIVGSVDEHISRDHRREAAAETLKRLKAKADQSW